MAARLARTAGAIDPGPSPGGPGGPDRHGRGAPGGFRPGGMQPGGFRPGGFRPDGGPRPRDIPGGGEGFQGGATRPPEGREFRGPAGPRPGQRSFGPRAFGPRPGGSRPFAPRPGGSRPEYPRPGRRSDEPGPRSTALADPAGRGPAGRRPGGPDPVGPRQDARQRAHGRPAGRRVGASHRGPPTSHPGRGPPTASPGLRPTDFGSPARPRPGARPPGAWIPTPADPAAGVRATPTTSLRSPGRSAAPADRSGGRAR